MSKGDSLARPRHGFIVAFCLLGIAAINRLFPEWANYGPNRFVWAWVLTVMLSWIAAAAVGSALQGQYSGLVIDNRNRISLSKLQALVWSVVILSALIVYACSATFASGHSADHYGISPELLGLMGISAGTVAAAPAILSVKGAQVDSRESADKARWTDIFSGDEVSNANSPDLSKFQQVIVSLTVLGIYATAIGNSLNTAHPSGFPALDANLLWLIGISHGGYLAYKAAPHSALTGNAPAGASSETDDGALG